MLELISIVIAIFAGLFGMLFVGYLARGILVSNPGTEKAKEISQLIYQGAMAFLRREYRIIAYFAFTVAIIILFAISKYTALAFICGAGCSLLAGFIGMSIATRANAPTAKACSTSFGAAVSIAFRSGAVMGISVVSLGLMGLSVVYLLLIFVVKHYTTGLLNQIFEATKLVVGFSMGASLVALFARMGGGIYTKAADVGADLVGKIEAGIPEDDPRNPAVIADNVGDNVGDVAGMGADLYESYVGAIVSGLVIAATPNPFIDVPGVWLVLLLSAWGIFSSIMGVFFIGKDTGERDPQVTLNIGMIGAVIIFVLGAFFLTAFWYRSIASFWSVLSGLISGMLVGFVAQYYTSGKIIEGIADAAKTGPATAIIEGLAQAMMSTVLPLVAIGIATIIAYKCSGIFGIALSAIGMLALTGTTVAVDAYGPVADNAAGISEMAQLGSDIRRRAERLDAVGNTTAAIGKGFAIGSAALTALALFTAYATTVGLSLGNIPALNALDARVIAGVFIGGIVPFIFCAKTLQAVGRSAHHVVDEVRRQWLQIPGLKEGKVMPDSARCVDIVTAGALRKMMGPGTASVVLPILMGIILGKEALGGFLIGSLITGVPLAIFLANVGGAWDNAKKFVEEGNLGGKGSDVHKATVVCDTIGDPCKDTSGPSLNILLKLMAVVSLVFGLLLVNFHEQLANILPFLK
jgi:K(+)-stimulated pyrophosphate-energized sodium pump